MPRRYYGSARGQIGGGVVIGGFNPPKKKGANPPTADPPPGKLQSSDVRSLQALRARGHFEFNCLAFVQRLIPIRRE